MLARPAAGSGRRSRRLLGLQTGLAARRGSMRCTSSMKAWKWTRRFFSATGADGEEQVHQHRLAAADLAVDVEALRCRRVSGRVVADQAGEPAADPARRPGRLGQGRGQFVVQSLQRRDRRGLRRVRRDRAGGEQGGVGIAGAGMAGRGRLRSVHVHRRLARRPRRRTIETGTAAGKRQPWRHARCRTRLSAQLWDRKLANG